MATEGIHSAHYLPHLRTVHTVDCSQPFKLCFENCYDDQSSTGKCWKIVVTQFVLSILFLLLAEIKSRVKKQRIIRMNAAPSEDEDDDSLDDHPFRKPPMAEVASHSALDADESASFGDSGLTVRATNTHKAFLSDLRQIASNDSSPYDSEAHPRMEKQKSTVTFGSAPVGRIANSQMEKEKSTMTFGSAPVGRPHLGSSPDGKFERPQIGKKGSILRFGLGEGKSRIGTGTVSRPGIEKGKSTVTFGSDPDPSVNTNRNFENFPVVHSDIQLDDDSVSCSNSLSEDQLVSDNDDSSKFERPQIGKKGSILRFGLGEGKSRIGTGTVSRPGIEKGKSTVTFGSDPDPGVNTNRNFENFPVVHSDIQLDDDGISCSNSLSEDQLISDNGDSSKGSHDKGSRYPDYRRQEEEDFLPSQHRESANAYSYEMPPNMRKTFLFGQYQSMRNFLSLSRNMSIMSSMTNRNSGSKKNLTVGMDSPVLETHRSEINFLRTNDDPDIEYPSDYDAEYKTLEQDSSRWSKVLRSVLNHTKAQCVVLSSTGYSLLTSSLVSLLSMRFKYEDNLREHCDVDFYDIREWVENNYTAIRITLDGYKFLPIFLLLAYMGFLVERWRQFLLTCHTIQGRIHDIGFLCGSGVKTPVDINTQKKMYTIYRYLNVVHILCLKNFSPALRQLKVDPNYASDLGLLTEKEATLVSSMENKGRDGVITLLAFAAQDLLEPKNGISSTSNKTIVLDKICDLRGSCSKLHDLFVRDNPNEYIISMQALVTIYGGLVVFGFPFVMSTYASSSPTILSCLHPAAFLGPFFICLSITFPLVLFKKLQNPFADDGGIEVDNLIASTELCLFQNMRCLWHIEKSSSQSRYQSLVGRGTRRRRFSIMTKGTYGEL